MGGMVGQAGTLQAAYADVYNAATAAQMPPLPAPGTQVFPNSYQASIGIAYFTVQGDGSLAAFAANGTPWIGPTTPAQIAAFTYGGSNNAIGAGALMPTVQLSVPGYQLAAVPPGAPFTLTMTGFPALQSVTVREVFNGTPGSPVQLGQTDSNGNLTLTGAMPVNPGSYQENYVVSGGGQLGSVSYVVTTPGAAPATIDPTTTVRTPFAQPRLASGSQPPTAIVTVPADSRGTGYGTLPPGTQSAVLNFSIPGGVPLSAVPAGFLWEAQITGAPAGAHIVVNTFVNGQPWGGPSDIGAADSSGMLTMYGNMPASPLGSWHEVYTVNGVPFAVADFTIVPGLPPMQSTALVAGTVGGPYTPAGAPAVSTQQFGTAPYVSSGYGTPMGVPIIPASSTSGSLAGTLGAITGNPTTMFLLLGLGLFLLFRK